jgi:hypothetical protein
MIGQLNNPYNSTCDGISLEVASAYEFTSARLNNRRQRYNRDV